MRNAPNAESLLSFDGGKRVNSLPAQVTRNVSTHKRSMERERSSNPRLPNSMRNVPNVAHLLSFGAEDMANSLLVPATRNVNTQSKWRNKKNTKNKMTKQNEKKTQKVGKILHEEFSGFFARGDLDEHDKNIVTKWIAEFAKMLEKKGESDASD